MGSTQFDAPTLSALCDSPCIGNPGEFCGGAPGAGPFLQLYFASNLNLQAQAALIITSNALQPYCQGLLNYQIPQVVVTTVVTQVNTITSQTPVGTVFVHQTPTSTLNVVTLTATAGANVALPRKDKRIIGINEPAPLAVFPDAVITAACAQVIPSPTVTSVVVQTQATTLLTTTVEAGPPFTITVPVPAVTVIATNAVYYCNGLQGLPFTNNILNDDYSMTSFSSSFADCQNYCVSNGGCQSFVFVAGQTCGLFGASIESGNVIEAPSSGYTFRYYDVNVCPNNAIAQ